MYISIYIYRFLSRRYMISRSENTMAIARSAGSFYLPEPFFCCSSGEAGATAQDTGVNDEGERRNRKTKRKRKMKKQKNRMNCHGRCSLVQYRVAGNLTDDSPFAELSTFLRFPSSHLFPTAIYQSIM